MSKNIDDFKPKFYAIRWGWNDDRPEKFNIYDWCGHNLALKVRKYDNRPGKYKRYDHFDLSTHEPVYIYGWEALVADIRVTLMYYFWAKSEHEVIVSEWPPHIDKETGETRAYKLDVFDQLEGNVENIARDLLRQYREWKKEK